MSFFDDDDTRDKMFIGRHGPQKDAVLAGIRIERALPKLLELKELGYRWRAGDENFRIPRHVKDYKTWNKKIHRLSKQICGSGLLLDIFMARQPGAAIMVQFWPRPYEQWYKKDDLEYPKINMPSDLTLEETQQLWALLRIYYLTVRYQEEEPRQFAFGLYSSIPKEYWIAKAKQKGKNRRKSKIVFPDYVDKLNWGVAGPSGIHISQALYMAIREET